MGVAFRYIRERAPEAARKWLQGARARIKTLRRNPEFHWFIVLDRTVTYCTSGMDPCLPSRRLVDSLRSLKSVRSEARNGRLRRSWRMEFRITSTMPSMMAWQSNHQSRSSCFPGPAFFAPGGSLPADVSSADGSGWRSGDDTRGAWLLARGNCSFTTSTS